MATKKNLVKSMLMSVATAGIFSFSFVFTSCNDDDILESGVTPPDMEQEYNGPLQEPYGLSFYDFVASDDVTPDGYLGSPRAPRLSAPRY